MKFKRKYRDNPRSFAYGTNIYKILWMFVIGSVVGYLLETVWYFVIRGYYVDRRGVLIGPFSPIYGVAMVIIMLSLYKIRNMNAGVIMFISGIFGGVFEFICSVLQEYILGTKSWDYSHKAFNIGGRTSLQFMIMWGVLGIVFIQHTYPWLSEKIENIPPRIGKSLSIILGVFLIIDCVFSLQVSIRQKDRRHDIPPRNVLEKAIDFYYTDEKLSTIYSEIRIID